MLQLFDTHCHIHEGDYPGDSQLAYERAIASGVERMIMVGTSAEGSKRAVEFAATHPGAAASIALHPHEAVEHARDFDTIRDLAEQNSANRGMGGLVAVGECGLDYFYHADHSDRTKQQELLQRHLQLAIDYHLPLIFHVREGFDDFWPIFDSFSGLTGVLHSFTGTSTELEAALARGLYIGINGISTFTKDPKQQNMFDSVPMDRILLETDAPYLTPTPVRGTVNEPAYVKYVAEFHASRRNEDIERLSTVTFQNANNLFHL